MRLRYKHHSINEAPNGLSGYNLSISLSNASIAEIISVEFPKWATLHSSSSLPADSIWVKSADLNDEVRSGNKNVTLVSLTIRGDDYGDTKVLATATKMDDDKGSPINPSIKSGKFDPQSIYSLIYFNPQSKKTEISSIVPINISLDKAPSGLSGFNISISLSNPNIAEILSVNFPGWARLNSNASLPSDFLWIKGVDLNDKIKRGDSNISLATLMLIADEEGKTELIISVIKIDDDDGNPINASTTIGLLEVEKEKIYFDTGTPANPYPSISGTHKGAITPSQTITVSKLYILSITSSYLLNVNFC